MKTERIEIKVSKELKEKIESESKKLNISISAYIRMTLSQA